ncbi:MAG: ATP-binding protein [Candidatus Aminicenantes bacterium]|nr:ATP-binding protein [Candidatus Aminicenantes bacterium]NIM77515.1 ATP-binding protein [Candidatus Aminicenantes bacterium]NIN19812.1 ATP-binding protein [Candidatus Aminicenantes bacterium]NIN40707.1 ATP-binding protein [Candidatus Aminicenantes bacterium]NIN86438.1 ATP-binding protein [Candidatus Aminicenantes bacterium]
MLTMFSQKPELSISIPSKTELLKMVVDLTDHIATLNQFSTAESRKIALAVDEAITNVIKHSYKNAIDKDIKLEFYSSSEGLKVKIIFTGVPPVLERVGVNLSRMIKAKSKGGLGVELMRRIMDSVEYTTTENLNTCEMIKWKKKRSAV